jgi:hypothetical protein
MEKDLVGGSLGLLTLAGMAVSEDGASNPNPDVQASLSTAMTEMRIPLLDSSAVSDSDLSQVADDDLPQLKDRATYRLWRRILGTLLAKPSQRVGVASGIDYSDTIRELRAAISDLWDSIVAKYGPEGSGRVEVAIIPSRHREVDGTRRCWPPYWGGYYPW